jgi:hypothetical protein
MKKLILSIGFIAFVFGLAMSQTNYLQVEVTHLYPKPDKLDLFKKALAAHNRKYHATDPYKVSVSYSFTGFNAGSYTWIMGPTSFTQLDGRPAKGEHDIDWEKNVVPLCQSITPASYWRLNQELTYRPEGVTSMPKSRLRFNVVYPGKIDRYVEQMKKIVAVYKKKQYKIAFEVWMHYGLTDSYNVVSINSYANWAGLDMPIEFAKDFDEVNGTGSYVRFIEDFDACIDRSKTIDELGESVPELGGNMPATQ